VEQNALLHEIVFGIGTLGLVLAFLWLALRKKRSGAESETPKSQDFLKNQDLSSTPVPSEVFSPEVSSPHEESSWWRALSKTRSRFMWGSSKMEASQLREVLEEACLVSDLGVANTSEALDALDWKSLAMLPAVERELQSKQALAKIFSSWFATSKSFEENQSWPTKNSGEDPKVLWFVGVNGVGKTTSIAKLAAELKSRGHSVILAAGDTFRAAAGEQLESWAQRLGIDCIRGADGADSSAVLFDAIESAKARKIDFVLCDSAGRLHNQSQLMQALAKNKRVMAKALPEAPHETLLVLDAHTGQNMLAQAKQFQESVGITGLILTKMDGTARGGAVVAVARQTQTPLRRLGLGETEKDFVAFDADAFVAALLGLEFKSKAFSRNFQESPLY
jgi:fused signal recognition particle receptor